MKYPLPIVLLAVLAEALPAQSLAWRRLANPAPPIAAAWDSTRQRTVLAANDGVLRQWEWNGVAAEERLAALASISYLAWIGDDPLRRRLVALTSTPMRVGTWDGARWTWQTPPTSPEFSYSWRITFDERRARIVAYATTAGASDVHEWDGSQWWSFPATPGPIGRTGAAFAFDPIAQRCVLYGGTGNSSALADCWSWDGSTWTLLGTNGPPGARSGASLAFAPALGGLLLYGGSTATTTWRLAGTVWAQVPTAHDPGARDAALLVRDPLGMLLTGGSGDPFGTAWRFTGTDWIAATTFAAPPYPLFAAVGFDHARGQVVQISGLGYGAPTHVFDTRWHGTQPTLSPPARNGAQMCWSSIEQMVLLFGGIDGANTSLGDTWSWNGTDWLARSSPTSPPPRYGTMLAEDPNGGVMLFGGLTGTTTLGDHWHWNGAQWLQVTTTPLPPPNAFGHAALDPVRNRVVAIVAASVIAPQTWEWDGSAWTHVPTLMPTALYGSPLLAFDPRRGRIVSAGTTSFEWTGSSWVSVATNTNNITGIVGLVTDHARQRLLAVGTSVAILTPTPAGVEPFGFGCALGPSPALHAINDATPGNPDFALELGTLAPSAPTFLVLGLGAQSQSLGAGCTLLVAQPLATVFAMTPPSGQVLHPIPIPNDPGLRAVQFVAQGAVFDPPRSLLGSVTITAGLRITIGD